MWLWALVAAWLIGLISAASASAAGPVWQINSVANTTAQPGETITYHLQVQNVGTADTDGSLTTTTLTLPPGLTGVSATGDQAGIPLACAVGASAIQCATNNPVPYPAENASAFLRYTLVVAVDPGVAVPSTLTATVLVSGGGAADATTVDPTRSVDGPPEFGVDAFDAQIVADTSGTPLTQAGGHPHAITTAIDFNTTTNPVPVIGDLWPVEPTKDAVVDLPPGLVGSPAGVDQCTSAQLANGSSTSGLPLCPATSQVGTVVVHIKGLTAIPFFVGPYPVYSMVPPPGTPARFGFNVVGVVVTLSARLRSNGDYGLSIDGNNLSEGLAIAGTTVTFWGVPSDPSHTPERSCPGRAEPAGGGPSCPSGAPPRAFLRNPTSCAPSAGSPVQDGLATNLSIDSWDHPGSRDANGAPAANDPNWKRATWVTHALPGYPNPPSAFGPHQLLTGCEKVPFDPELSLAPVGPSRSNSPTPFAVDLSLPQSDDPTTIGEGDLGKAVVTLPVGVRVSPSSADGLGACTPAQIGLSSTADPTCPDSSKVASMTIKTPLLDEELTGSVYLASQNDNPFHSLLAIYLVAKGPGVIVKLAGHVEPDPTTGQLKTTVDNVPQLPFSTMHLEFKGGSRAALLTPPACGTYTTHAELTSWSGKTVDTDSSFIVSANSDGSPCAPAGFSPGFLAGTQDPSAGASTAFLLHLTRGDNDQEFNSLSVELPTGALAKIASVTPCSEGAANAGTCQDSAKVGGVTVGAGSGPSPFFIETGRAYLTGPYRGAPFGLSIVVPAVAGPFDLGNVVVRAKLDVDRHTAQAHVIVDPLPTILQGIPLGVRDIRTTIDRPDFFVNPTSCAAKKVLATVGSTLGTIAHVSSHFQMSGCEGLPLAPKMSLTVGARKHTRAGVSTPLTATVTVPPGNSNLRTVNVTLPGTLNALLPVVNRACKLTEFNAGKCTSRAKIGTVSVISPLLRDPLRGSAFFVKNPARPIPDLMFALHGQISLDVTAKVKIPGGTRLATSFDTIPDAPFSKLTLHIVSGNNGPIGIRTNLCSTKGRASTASVAYRGQNGALVKVNQRLKINGCPKAAKARKGRR